MVVLQSTVLEKLTLISFLHFQENRPLSKYFLITKILFCLSDFAKHLEKPLILKKNFMAQSQTYTLRQYTLYKLYAVPVRICITHESYHQYS